MSRLRLLRCFSSQHDPRLELLKGTAISPDQVRVKSDKTAKGDRLKTDFESHFRNMKNLFGEDYKTPNEKYDLHFPRVEVTGEKSAYERDNAKQGYRRGKVIAYSTGFVLFCGSVFVFARHFWDKQLQVKMFEQQRREEEHIRDYYYGIPNSLRERRLAEIQKLKQDYKEKFGVELDDKSLA